MIKIKNYQEEYIILSIHFYNEWKEDSNFKGTKFAELMSVLNRDIKKNIEPSRVPTILERGYKRMLDVVGKDEDVTCNSVILSIGFLMLLVEEDFFKGFKSMAIKRLVNEVYHEVWEKEKDNYGFKNANRLISKIDDMNKDK